MMFPEYRFIRCTLSEPDGKRQPRHPQISYVLEIHHEQGSSQGDCGEGKGQDK